MLLFPLTVQANPCIDNEKYNVGCGLEKGYLVLDHSTTSYTNGMLTFRIAPRPSPQYVWGEQVRTVLQEIKLDLKQPTSVELHINREGKLLNLQSDFASNQLRTQIQQLVFPPAPKDFEKDSVKFRIRLTISN